MQYFSTKRGQTQFALLSHFCFATFLLTACGPSEKLTLKGLDVSTSEVGATTYVNMEAIVVMGNLKFPNVEVPVMNPSTLQSFGQMALQSLSDGSNRISIMIDYSEATKLDPALGSTLPNGREIPSALGSKNSTLVGIPALEQSRIYLGGDLKKDLFVGVAIAIPAFDNVLSNVPLPLNIFFGFPFSSEVSGVAGLFTGPQKGQNGVAVFAKKSAPVPTPTTESFRILASVDETPTTEGSEIQRLDRITLFRLNHLLNKRAIVKVK